MTSRSAEFCYGELRRPDGTVLYRWVMPGSIHPALGAWPRGELELWHGDERVATGRGVGGVGIEWDRPRES